MTREIQSSNYLFSFLRLQEWTENQQFRGWDPYDALLTPLPWHILGKWGEVLLIQSLKRSPLNFRTFLKVPHSLNPKTIGLLLHAHALSAKIQPKGIWDERGNRLMALVEPLSSKGFPSVCWGYPFPWSSPQKRLPAWMPSSVVTGTMSRGLFAWHQQTGHERARDLVLQIPAFVLHQLHRYEDKTGICFSYTPDASDICYNASLFAAESLANAVALGFDPGIKEVIRQAVDFVVARQKTDGSWGYSADIQTGKERMQIDFHQGFILDSLFYIMDRIGHYPPTWTEALNLGASFYFKHQFTTSGRSLRRLPRKWPADIHAQAQGIISFSLLREMHPDYLPFARKIADWTIQHMQSSRGNFHYQRYPLGNIKIPYMRWGQAWMMVALASLLHATDSDPIIYPESST